ncbi:uncharacterized mitochondrial protein-like protein [Tanacetum coccineum]
MHDEFEMSMMGELNFFLGLQIKQMEDGIFFNQSKYIKEMLKKFGLEESKPMKTPMFSDTKLKKDKECDSVDSTKYRGMRGSLLYLTASIPDIMFSVCLCARFQEDPKTSHLEVVKRIFQYIEGTTHLGLWNDGTHSVNCSLLFFCLDSSLRSIPFHDNLITSSEFYSQYRVKYDLEGQMFVEFVIQNQFFSFTLEEFGQILGGPYQTNPPSPDEIKLYIQVERKDGVTRIRHDRVIDVEENQILTREITPIMKTWVDIICENVFCLGGNPDHVLACLCHMLYCIASVIYPLTAQQERKTRKDYGTKRGLPSTSSSSSSAFGQPFSSHHIDDNNDGNDEGTSRASTPLPTRFINSLSNDIPQVFSNPPHIDPNMEAFYTRQTEILNRQVQLQDGQQGGIRSIGKGIKNLLRGNKK